MHTSADISGLSAPAFHSFLKSHLPHFEIHVPFNPLPLIFTALAAAVGAIAVYALWDQLLPLIQSRILWGTGSLVLILTFTSGYMWNKIKNAPYVQMGDGGKMNWIAGGFQNQLGMESQVIGGICE
jgi:oligosaccharyltransferase complex subunit gamma